MQANTMYTETVFILPMTESVASNVSNHCGLLLHDIVPLFQISTNTNELKQYRCQTKEEDEEKKGTKEKKETKNQDPSMLHSISTVIRDRYGTSNDKYLSWMNATSSITQPTTS